jgi:hypothetical protein
MWFNGTAISNKAQRALRNENVTIVAHSSGYIHCLYDDATIDRDACEYFAGRLASYLSASLDLQIFANFLRSHQDYQKFFQVCRDCHGQPRFLRAETFFHYEHNSNFRIADTTHEKLLAEVSEEDFAPYELPGRVRCDQLDDFIKKDKIDLTNPQSRQALTEFFQPVIPDASQLVEKLADFTHIEPRLPAGEKNYVRTIPIGIPTDYNRQQIIDYLQHRQRHRRPRLVCLSRHGNL